MITPKIRLRTIMMTMKKNNRSYITLAAKRGSCKIRILIINNPNMCTSNPVPPNLLRSATEHAAPQPLPSELPSLMLSNETLQLKTLSESKMWDYWNTSQITQLPVRDLYRVAPSAHCVHGCPLLSHTCTDACSLLTPAPRAHLNDIPILICWCINISVLTIRSFTGI